MAIAEEAMSEYEDAVKKSLDTVARELREIGKMLYRACELLSIIETIKRREEHERLTTRRFE